MFALLLFRFGYTQTYCISNIFLCVYRVQKPYWNLSRKGAQTCLRIAGITVRPLVIISAHPCSSTMFMPWMSEVAIKMVSAIATIMIIELIQQEIEENTGIISAVMTHRGKPRQPQHFTCSLQTEPHADLSPQKNVPPHSTYSLNSTVNLCLCLYGSSYFSHFFPHFWHMFPHHSQRVESVFTVVWM